MILARLVDFRNQSQALAVHSELPNKVLATLSRIQRLPQVVRDRRGRRIDRPGAEVGIVPPEGACLLFGRGRENASA
jgi:hypothetical protein